MYQKFTSPAAWQKPSKPLFKVLRKSRKSFEKAAVNIKNYRAAYLSLFISMCLKVDTDFYYSQTISNYSQRTNWFFFSC